MFIGQKKYLNILGLSLRDHGNIFQTESHHQQHIHWWTRALWPPLPKAQSAIASDLLIYGLFKIWRCTVLYGTKTLTIEPLDPRSCELHPLGLGTHQCCQRILVSERSPKYRSSGSKDLFYAPVHPPLFNTLTTLTHCSLTWIKDLYLYCSTFQTLTNNTFIALRLLTYFLTFLNKKLFINETYAY